MNNHILVYTRIPTEDYTASLANSVHFAIKSGEKDYMHLNKNYGILFAKAVIDERDVIIEKGLKNPFVFKIDDDTFGITAERVNGNGGKDTECGNKIILWTTQDFIRFTEHGLVQPDDGRISKAQYVGDKKETNLNGIVAGNTIDISIDLIEKITEYYFPGFIKAKSEKYKFPLAIGYADPVVFKWKEKYYFTATNDNVNAIGLFVREANTVDELFAPDVKETLILDYDESKGFIQTFWAPEFHVIGGNVYILFAVSGRKWSPQSHIMKLKKGGSIINSNDWEEPVRIIQADGSFLTEDGITLDMTYFSADDRHYFIWSYRKGIGTPIDTGSMLYIAEIDVKSPWILKSEPVLLSRPLYGWENLHGTINNEGAYALITNDNVYITYSGGAAGDYTYALGTLSISKKRDYLNPNEWEKSPCPILSYYSFEGEYGPGHNSFFCDEEGKLMIVYHAQSETRKGKRCTAIKQVCFKKDGTYFFDKY